MKAVNSELDKFKPSSSDFEFQQFPFYWLMRVGSVYSVRMEKSLKKGGINITAWRILMILRENGTLSVSDIATHAVAKTPTITRATYKLQNEGHVVISTSEKDGRISMVELTDSGLNAVAKVNEQSMRLFDNIYEDLSAEQIEILNNTLRHLFHNLSEY
jgi:DNA-binding MarR family transcriptional regulator